MAVGADDGARPIGRAVVAVEELPRGMEERLHGRACRDGCCRDADGLPA